MVGYYATFFENSCFYTWEASSGENLFAKFQAASLQLIILDITKPFESKFWERLEYRREIMD